MQYHFSTAVRHVLGHARDQALELKHDYVAPQHMLIAITSVPGVEEVPTVRDPDALRQALKRSLGVGRARMQPGEIPYTSLAKRSLEFAMADAREHNQNGVYVHNLLRGILRADSEMAMLAREYGLTADGSQSESRTVAGARLSADTGREVWYLKVDASSETPIYEQIVQRIEEAVATGSLIAGERLPAVRELAAELEVAPGTVARAYAALEERGVVITEGARGTRVAERTVTRGRDAERESALEALLKPIVVAAFHMGAKAQELRDALERAMKGILNGGRRSA